MAHHTPDQGDRSDSHQAELEGIRGPGVNPEGLSLKFTDFGDYQEIAELLSGLSEAEKAQAIALAIRGTSREEDRRELQRQAEELGKRLDYVTSLTEQLDDFIEYVAPNLDSARQLTQMALALGSVNHQKVRASSMTRPVAMARSFDGFMKGLLEQTSIVAGLAETCGLFRSVNGQIERIDRGVPALEIDPELLRVREEHASGFLMAVEDLIQNVDRYPVFCRNLVSGLQENDRVLKKRYLDEGEKQAPEFEMGLPGAHEEKVPVYQGNLHLTAFLHELANRIPTKPEEGNHFALASYQSELNEFLATLGSHGDPALLAGVKSPTYYRGVASTLSALYSAFRQIRSAYAEAGLHEAEEAKPGVDRDRYRKAAKKAMTRARGEAADKLPVNFETFNPAEIQQAFLKYAPRSEEATAANKNKNVSEKQQAYLSLFEKLDGVLEKIAEEAMGGDAFLKSEQGLEQIEELVELKSQLFGSEKQKKRSRLKQDKESGNLCYSATQEGMGQLALEQVPTHNTRFEDVKGSSWREVMEKVDGILEYTELGFLYSQMSSRGKANNNLLIVGPYGCGKNEFMKALMSDPRTIGVNMTTDRLMSMWHGQDENNTRALFEISQRKHEEEGKPVVIGWDEFDSNFSKKSNGFSVGSELDGKRQKILQSVLEGDTVYDGVALIGLSNEPMQIPVAIYRRFADVVIIQPLEAEERVDLLQHMLAGMPLEEGFDANAGWDEFMQNTDYASGHIIGRIYDHAFNEYVRKLKTTDREAAKRVNDDAKEITLEGEKLTAKERVKIFRDNTRLVLTGEDFRKAQETVLARTDIIQGIEQQKLFYRDVESMMEAAFNGSL